MELSSSQLQQRTNTTTPASFQIPVKAVQTVLYSLAIALMAAAITWLIIAVSGKVTAGNSVRVIVALVFWAIGLAHIFIYHPLLSLLQQRNGWLFTIVQGCLISAASFAMFTIAGWIDWALPLVAGAAFVLPHLVQQLVFNFFTLLPAAEKGWIIPAGVEADKRMSLLLNSMHFKICIRVHAADRQAYEFSVNLPSRLELSMVFLRFLYDRQNEVEITDEAGRDYGWQFWILRRLGAKKMLDPSLSLKQNGVRKGDVIYIERIAPAR